MEHLAENLAVVEERLAKVLALCGRRREDLTVIAVTKTFPAEAMIAAYHAGLREFGENYVQEFEQKAPFLKSLSGARFHLIGHLQSNKVNKAAPIFDVIQTVDSAKLAERLSRTGKALDVMIEVKLSDEEAKYGCASEDVEKLRDRIQSLPGLQLSGLMTMPPFFEDPEQSRPYFVRLRELSEQLGIKGLSMGMSNDFEVAVEEGATHIRLGTVLFGKRSPRQ